jgi:hypothetical protein
MVFAIAGLLAATAPIVIHLFNRRRFREIDWAAMDFLLEASSRSRSLLHLRDILLLALRTAAVALFGLAIARPYFASRSGTAAGASAPVHAILVIDNSGSMGRDRLGGRTLLDDARDRAKEFVERLPPGSRTSVLPLCGPAGGFSYDAHRTREDASEAIDAIRLVDRAGTVALAIDLARQAAGRAPDLPDKRTVFIGDQQAMNWPADASALAIGTEAGGSTADAGVLDDPQAIREMQVVAVVPQEADNTWVDSFRVEDAVADADLPATLTAVIRHQGEAARPNVQVTLSLDGAEVATETIDLEPGQSREVTFTQRLDATPEPGRPAFVAATVSLPPDTLPEDDVRALVVPVVASLPIVFADQLGAAGEEPRRGRYGETRHLRRLLAPVVSRGDNGPQLVQVRHVRIDAIDEDLLDGVRMVVVAGVRSPGETVPLLRDFVRRGGQLVIAAGAEFDPDEWNRTAWLEGRGILPVPLDGTVGTLPDEPGQLKPFQLDWPGMRNDALFQLPGVPDDELADLYGTPLFFKAVASDLSSPDDLFLAAEAAGSSAVEPSSEAGAGPSSGDDAAARDATSTGRRHLPRVLAAFDNGRPFLVSRRIGAGQVLWVSTGLFSPWNTLPKTNAMLVFDRLLRGMLAETLPAVNLETADQFTLPVAAGDRQATIRLARPDGVEETLSIEAVSSDAYGVTLRDLSRRGIYTVTAMLPEPPAVQPTVAGAAAAPRQATAWKRPLACNGPARESEPQLLDAGTFAERFGGQEGLRWVGPGETIGLDGARVSGQGSWWWLLLAVIACLLAESAILAAPYWSSRSSDAAAQPSAAVPS